MHDNLTKYEELLHEIFRLQNSNDDLDIDYAVALIDRVDEYVKSIPLDNDEAIKFYKDLHLAMAFLSDQIINLQSSIHSDLMKINQNKKNIAEYKVIK